MKTKDRIKEEIGLEKLLLTLIVAIVSSLSSWTWSNKIILPAIVVFVLYLICFAAAITALKFFIKIKLK